MMLVLSPHLDDAAFSCGGVLAGILDATVATIFTRSVLNPTGFALACQRDKNLPDEVDYMALRRAEDTEAMRLLGVQHQWWGFSEAPHRGYVSAPDLFSGIHAEDVHTSQRLQTELTRRITDLSANAILYPYGAGNHVDHLQVIEAVRKSRKKQSLPSIQYFDQPYANRHRDLYRELDNAASINADDLLDAAPGYYRVTISPKHLKVKYAACEAYLTQVPFQFTDGVAMRSLLGTEEYYFVA